MELDTIGRLAQILLDIISTAAFLGFLHASLTIETVLQVCFRLLVALTLAAIVVGAFSLLALAAENPTGINPTLQAIDDPQDPTAQYILGHRYAYGRGKPRDYAKAL